MGLGVFGVQRGWGAEAGLAQQGVTAPSPFPCRTHMQNIKDITSNIHFEAYRVKRLNEGQSSLSNGVADRELVANEM